MSAGDGYRRILDSLHAHGAQIHTTNDRNTMATCPAHPDRTPSLSLTRMETKALVKCKAGCDTDDVLAALDLTYADLFDDPPTKTGVPDPNWMPCTRDGHTRIEEYTYRDEFGKTLYGVARCDHKCFRQWHPDPGSGTGKRWNMEGVRRVPYRLPELLVGIAQGDTAWIVEGERDVHAVAERHPTVTCNSGGAGSWLPEFATHFDDTDIVIVADRDKPGHDHAAAVAQTLLPVANSITIVRAAHGKDARDHFTGGGHLGNFVTVAEPKKWLGPNTITARLLADFTQ